MNDASNSQTPPVESQPEFLAEVARMTGRLEATCTLEGLDRLAEAGTLPAEFFEHFNAALECYDRLIDFVLDFSGAAQRVCCRKGCSNCCVDLVRGVTTPEIVNIYHHVRGWPDARQLFEYHRASAEIFMDILQGMLAPGETEFGGRDPRVEQAQIEYNRRLRPCGFLDQDTGCCRIYPVRPLACRYFFSLDPPETCTPAHPKYLHRDTVTVHLPTEIHALILTLARRLGFRPLDYLAGAFCGFAAEVMHARPIKVWPAGGGGTS